MKPHYIRVGPVVFAWGAWHQKNAIGIGVPRGAWRCANRWFWRFYWVNKWRQK